MPVTKCHPVDGAYFIDKSSPLWYTTHLIMVVDTNTPSTCSLCPTGRHQFTLCFIEIKLVYIYSPSIWTQVYHWSGPGRGTQWTCFVEMSKNTRKNKLTHICVLLSIINMLNVQMAVLDLSATLTDIFIKWPYFGV